LNCFVNCIKLLFSKADNIKAINAAAVTES